ncbi:MAG: radical SAM protein [Anaerolineae bacterium]
MSRAEELYTLPWPELQALAWQVRRASARGRLVLAVPGLKRYETEHYSNCPDRFVAVSITGAECARGCAHCQGRLLGSMLPAATPEALLAVGRRLREDGCRGLLLSGACDPTGAVPLGPYVEAMAELTALGLRLIAHTGLLSRSTAVALKQAGVSQALLDVVGDADTCREVLNLERTPADYAEALRLLDDIGLPAAPHVVAGLHFGQLRGELRALEMIAASRPAALVIVALRPLPGTPMAQAGGPLPAEVGRLLAVARLVLPAVPLTLGCARPSGLARREMERLAVLAGVDALAYPDPATVALAADLGLETRFVESCCSLATL